MQGDPHVRFDEQGVETGGLVSPTGETARYRVTS